ncbi:MAG: PDZ domain-containing protein [Acidimicrobiia bacterium]|nr:trypsin-like peptidase domain-containing protein [Acidimicrobiia bacterium]NNF10844.1 PDZ domain-containing protein [Acidimicrobiia bacterium]NNL71163.1 PDZ domain-containing protein [Acidimicrobiia bacterium]
MSTNHPRSPEPNDRPWDPTWRPGQPAEADPDVPTASEDMSDSPWSPSWRPEPTTEADPDMPASSVGSSDSPWSPSWPPREPATQPDLPAASERAIDRGQDALPIGEPAGTGAILYPSDPTAYPSPSGSQPEPTAELEPSPAPTPVPPATLPAPAPAPARAGMGRGLVIGIVASAVIAAAGFGLGRLTADNEGPPVATVVDAVAPGNTTDTSLVTTDDTPPVVVVPQSDGTVEPVAAAAAAITPAVVRLDTGTGTGSGVIYDANGYILTAAHVVGNASSVAVRFADGSSTTGTVLGADDVTDVAVVEIDADLVPAVAQLALGADLTVGQTAVAVGSPFRLDQTVTAGIISAEDRIVNQVSMVQTDAAINPGNSGGPLVDLQGRVLGINDVIFTNSNDNAGVGFAISIDLAKIVADQITAGEPVALALLGVSVGPSPDGDAGGLIQDVSDGTAAAAAGIEVGDLVIAVDGEPIRDSEELRAQVITRAPGTVLNLELIRDGQQITIDVTLGSIGTN